MSASGNKLPFKMDNYSDHPEEIKMIIISQFIKSQDWNSLLNLRLTSKENKKLVDAVVVIYINQFLNANNFEQLIKFRCSTTIGFKKLVDIEIAKRNFKSSEIISGINQLNQNNPSLTKNFIEAVATQSFTHNLSKIVKNKPSMSDLACYILIRKDVSDKDVLKFTYTYLKMVKDKIEKLAKDENKNIQEIIKKYEDDYREYKLIYLIFIAAKISVTIHRQMGPTVDSLNLYPDFTKRLCDLNGQYINLSNFTFEGMDFDVCNLSNIDLYGAELKNMRFFNVNFTNINLHKATLKGVVFQLPCLLADANLDFNNVMSSKIEGAIFLSANNYKDVKSFKKTLDRLYSYKKFVSAFSSQLSNHLYKELDSKIYFERWEVEKKSAEDQYLFLLKAKELYALVAKHPIFGAVSSTAKAAALFSDLVKKEYKSKEQKKALKKIKEFDIRIKKLEKEIELKKEESTKKEKSLESSLKEEVHLKPSGKK